MLAGKAPGHGALVERVPDGDARHVGRAADAGLVFELVHHAGVGRQGLASRHELGYVAGQERTEVAGVLTQGVVSVVPQGFVDFVGAAANGLHQSATTYDGVEFKGNVVSAQLVEHEVATKVELIHHTAELCEFLNAVFYVGHGQSALIFVYGYFGGCSAGVYYEYFHLNKVFFI